MSRQLKKYEILMGAHRAVY